MEDKKQQIVDLYISKNLISEKYRDAVMNANEDQINALWDLGIKNNLFSEDKKDLFFDTFSVKKKEYTEEQLRSAQESLQGYSKAPSELELASEVPSTTQETKEGELPIVSESELDLDKKDDSIDEYTEVPTKINDEYIQGLLGERIQSIYQQRGMLSPQQKIERFTKQQQNIYNLFESQAEQWQKQGLSADDINKRYNERIKSVMDAYGISVEDGKIKLDDKSVTEYESITKKAIEDVDKQIMQVRSDEIKAHYEDQGFGEEMWKSLKSASIRAYGGAVAIPALVNATTFEFIEKPILKAFGKTDEEINKAREESKYEYGAIGGVLPIQSEAYQDRLNKSAAAIERTMKQYDGGIIASIENNEYGDAGRQIAKGFMQSLPYLAMTATTSGGGSAATLASIGTVAAGQRYGEIRENGLMDGDYKKQLFNSWLYGGFEAAGELVTAGLINKLKGAVKGASKEAVEEISKGVAREWIEGTVGEGLSEGLITELGQQLTDYIQGNRDNIDLRQIGDATIIGSFAVAPITTITATANKIKGSRIASKTDVEKVNENTAKILDLEVAKERLDLKADKEALDGDITDLRNENQEVYDKNEKLAKALTENEFNKVEELNSRIDEYDKTIALKQENNEDVTTDELIQNSLIKQRDKILNEAIARDVLAKEEQPKYSIDGVEYTSKEEFLADVDKFSTKESAPDIRVENDNETYSEVVGILESKTTPKTQIEALETTKEGDVIEATTEEQKAVKRAEIKPTEEEIKTIDKNIEVLQQEKTNLEETLKGIPEDQKGKIEQEISDINQQIGELEDAKEQQSREMRVEGQQEKIEEVSDKDMPEIDRAKLQDGEEVKKEITPKEQFKQDFLSAEENLNGIDVPLKMSERKAARKNLLEGKDTKQAQILQEYIDKSFDQGKMDLIAVAAGGKTVRTQAPVTEIIKAEPVVEKPVSSKIEPTEKPITEKTKAKEGTIKIPKEKKAVSERFLQKEEAERGKNTIAYKLVEERSKKSEYSQEEAYQKGAAMVKKNIDEDGNVDEAGFYKDLRKTSVEDLDVGNFALMHLKQVYDKYAKDNTLTKEQREHYQRKVSEIVNEMADRGTSEGRGAASWAKIYQEDPSFDARVRLVETLKRNRDDLTKGEMPDGKNIQEYIAEVKQEVEKAFTDEINKLLKDNAQLKNAINKLKQDSSRKNIKEQGKEIANLIRKAKAPKDLAFVTIVPIQAIWNPSMEVVAKTVETLTSAAQGAVDMAKIIAQAVQEGLNWIKQQKWYKDLTKEEQARFDKYYEKKATETAEGKQDVEEVIKQHYSQKNDPRTLVEKLVEDAGLTKAQAQKIKSIVAFEVSKRAKQKLVEIKKQRDTGWKGNSIDRIIEAVQNGNLDEDTWLNSFSEKFGFQPITKEFAQLIKVMVDEIQALHDEEQYYLKRHVNLELNNLLKKVKKQELTDIFKAINNWQYTMVLTSINTIYNANVGSTISATLETLPYLIKQGFLPAFFAAKQLKFAPKHFKEFLETTNSHRGFYDHLGIFDESHHTTQESKFEMAMAKPFFSMSEQLLNSIKNKSDRKEVAKFFKEWTAQTFRKSLAVVSIIKGWDAFMRGVMADLVYGAEEFVKAAEDLGYKGTLQSAKIVAKMKDIATIFDKAAKDAGLDKQTISGIKEQTELDYANKKEHFEQLGIPFPRGYKNRRFLELKMESGDAEHYRSALDAATDAVMLGTPQGIPGGVYQLIQKMFTYGKKPFFQTGTFLARSFLLFPRISLNFINRVATNVPVFGAIPSVMGIEIDSKTGDVSWQWIRKDTRKMVKSLATNAAITMGGVMLFLDAMDWDDEEDKWVVSTDRHFDFTSYGTGDYGKNRQYGITKPYAMRFRWDNDNEFNEDWFGFYLLPHLLPVVGWLGRMMDDDKGIMTDTRKAMLEERYADRIVSDKKYWEKIKDITRRIPDLGNVSLRVMGEAQYNSISRVIKKYKGDEDKVGAAGRAALQTLAEPLKTLSQPAIARDIFNEFYRQQDIPEKETQKQFWAELGKNYYISELFIENDKLDLYGNPIPRNTRFFKFVDMYLKEYGDRPEYKLLTKYEHLKRPNMYWLPAKKGYTAEDKYDARDYARKSFGYYTVNGLDYLQDMSKEELEAAMEVMWEFAKDDANLVIDARNAKPELTDKELEDIYENYRSKFGAIRTIIKNNINREYGINIEERINNINKDLLKMRLDFAIRNPKNE